MKRLTFIFAVLMSMCVSAKDFGTFNIEKDDFIRVYDGDTFFIKHDNCPPVLCERIGVRINGIDTPEIRGKCQLEKDAAILAKKELQAALESGYSIELRHTTKEKYGRLLGELYIDDENFGDTLVAKGLARAYDGGARSGWCE